MTDKAIAGTRQQKALAPDKPFFVYLAPGATHAPHHVGTEWADRYAGRFDRGWDVPVSTTTISAHRPRPAEPPEPRFALGQPESDGFRRLEAA